jgi:hypothetical protein
MHFRICDRLAERSAWLLPPIDAIPVKLRNCALAVRAFNVDNLMTGSELVEGQQQLEDAIERLFADPRTAHLHLHFAAAGCYAARVNRFYCGPRP